MCSREQNSHFLELVQNICIKNRSCCNRGSFFSLHHKWLASQSAQTKPNKSCHSDAWCFANGTMWDTGRSLYPIILMIDFGSGISERSNQHLRFGPLVSQVIQLHPLRQSQGFFCCTSRDIFVLCAISYQIKKCCASF